MKFRIITVGRPKLDYAKLGFEEYLKRLRPLCQIEWIHVKSCIQKEDESKKLLEASEGSYRIALDENGRSLTTQQMVSFVSKLEREAHQVISFLIGGADGHSSNLLQLSQDKWSLSGGTLQHELATLVLLEQIYRVITIKKGMPYHRC